MQRMINCVEILLAWHLKRILSALIHGMNYEVISTVWGVSRNALTPVKSLRTILFLNLIDEFELLRISLMLVLRPLLWSFAFWALFPGSHPRLSGNRHGNRILESALLHSGLMSLLILAVVELICNLWKRLFLILRRCFHLHHYVPLWSVIVHHICERIFYADWHWGHWWGLSAIIFRPEMLNWVVSMSVGHEFIFQLLLLFGSALVVRELVHH